MAKASAHAFQKIKTKKITYTYTVQTLAYMYAVYIVVS